MEKAKFSANENFVDISTIKEIASEIIFPTSIGSSNLKNSELKAKSINSIDEIKNGIGKTSFYIVNYNEGGFIILSADYRIQPILGFSTDNHFFSRF
jgi:hypothetical protein